MKKTLLLTLFASFCLSGLCQSNDYQVDTSYYYFWDTDSDDWMVSQYTANIYDSAGTLTEIKNGSWSSYTNTWREYRREYKYDSLLNLSEDYYHYWNADSNDWVLASRNSYDYDSAGNKTGHYSFSKDQSTGEWIKQNYYLFQFDSAGNEIGYYSHFWSIDSNNWFNSSYSLRLHDSAGNRQQMDSWQWNFDSNDWVNLNHYEYEYDSNGNLKEYFRQRWETDHWAMSYRYKYEYDIHGSRIKSQRYNWNSSAQVWEVSSYVSYLYDSKGILLEYTSYYRSSWDGYFEPDYQYKYVYKPLAGRHLGIHPAIIDFGKLEVSSTSIEKQLFLRNTGDEDLMITALIGPDSIFNLKGFAALPAVIEPSGLMALEVDFSPNESLLYTDTIFVISDDTTRPEEYVLLSGEGVEAQAADSGLLYLIISRDTEVVLASVDPSSGKEMEIGPTGLTSLHGISINSEGMIYGANRASGDIFKIDAGTGIAIPVVKTGIKYITSLAFGAGDDLYATADGKLLQIDLNSGFSQPKDIQNYYLETLAWDRTEDMLWSYTSSGYLVLIDPLTNTVNPVAGPSNDPNLLDMAFDFAGNLLSIAYTYPGIMQILSIDKTTLKSVPSGFNPQGDLYSMAFFNVPMPGKHLSVVPDSINFGIVELNQSSDTVVVKFTNIGTDNFSLNEMEVPDTLFMVLDLPVTPMVLSTGSSVSIRVTFMPNTPALFTDTIKLISDETEGAVLNVLLSGSGILIEKADSGGLYALTESVDIDSSRLLEIDPSNGSASFIGNSGIIQFSGVAINSTGQLYGVDYNGTIFKVDARTGYPVPVFETGLYNMNAFAFNTNDVLYAMSYSSLYKIDLSKKEFEFIGYTGFIIGMSFNPQDGILWAITSSGSLYGIDHLSGTSAYLGYIPVNGLIYDIAFDYSGQLFGVIRDYQDNYQLVKLDITNLQIDLAGDIGSDGIVGMDFYKVPKSGRHLSVIPDSIDFGVVATVRPSDVFEILLRNIGSETVTVDLISLPYESILYIDEMNFPFEIQTGKDSTINIRYKPKESELLSGNIIIQSNAEVVEKKIHVRGEGFGVDTIARKAIQFSDAGDYLEIPNSMSLSPEEFTFEFWLKISKTGLGSEAGGEQNILDKRGWGHLDGYNLRLVGTSFPVSVHGFLHSPSGNSSIAEIDAMNKEVWRHFAFSRNLNGTLKLYMDGELVQVEQNTKYSINSTVPLRIGEYLNYPSGSLGLHGELDDLRIWNYARSDQEIEQYLSKELTGNESGLSAYWNFNYTLVNLVPGHTENRNDGQLFGNAKLVDSEVPRELNVHVPELFRNQQIFVYPNPFSLETTIQFSNETGGSYELTIRDMTGKIVRIINDITESHIVIRREDLSSGIYLYELNGLSMYRGKIIIH